MKIKLNLNIFLLLLLFVITNQIKIYCIIMLFAFIHEIAHMVCGIILGYKPETFRIMPLGFSIEFKTKVDEYNKKILKSNKMVVNEIFIALAGPLINLIIVILGVLHNIDENIIYSNFLIFIFNLLPIYPLDGGRILRNIIKIFYGNRKSNQYMNSITNIFFVVLTMTSSILILIYKNIAILAILIVLWEMIFKENGRFNTYNKIYKIIDKTYD